MAKFTNQNAQFLSFSSNDPIFLFFLYKLEVFRVFMPKIEKIFTVGKKVFIWLKMTLKNHF